MPWPGKTKTRKVCSCPKKQAKGKLTLLFVKSVVSDVVAKANVFDLASDDLKKLRRDMQIIFF